MLGIQSCKQFPDELDLKVNTHKYRKVKTIHKPPSCLNHLLVLITNTPPV